MNYDYTLFKGKKIIFCLPGRTFSNKFLLAWSKLLIKCIEYSIIFNISNKYTSNVYYVRNMCLVGDVLKGKKQLPFNGKDYDYIFWIDSDIVFNESDFFYMLENIILKDNIKILSGLYLMEGGTHYPVVKNMDISYFKQHGTFKFLSKNDALNMADFETVDYTGFGFMLIAKGVFEKLDYPWFNPITINIKDTEISDFCSEDVSFCLKMQKLDIPIYIASKVIVKHEKLVCL